MSDISTERLARLETAMESYVSKGRLAGAVLHVQQGGRTVYANAVGWRDREAEDPIRQDTIFRIASHTKAMTSVVAMMLVEEGKLVLSDPVGKYLPDWSQTSVAVAKPDGGYDVVPANRAITIRDLLTHTSGLSYVNELAEAAWRDAGFNGWYWADREEPLAASLKRMASLPLAAQPGEQQLYGFSTDLLGVVIEKIAGASLDTVLHERLFEPLDMRDTHFYLPTDKAERLAVVYSPEGNGIHRAGNPGEWQGNAYVGQGHFVTGPRTLFSGGVGLLSTAADNIRFLEMLRQSGELNGRRYLGRKTVELMVANQLGNIPSPPGTGFGLGFIVRTDLGSAGQLGTVGDFGLAGIYHSLYWVDPAEELSVVYMTQLLPPGDINDWEKVRALVYQAIK